MDIELLVEKVVNEVVRKMADQGIEKEKSIPNLGMCQGRLLAVLSRPVIHLDRYLETLLHAYPGYEISLIAPEGLHEHINSMGKAVRVCDADSEACRKEIIDAFEEYAAVCSIAPGFKLMQSLINMDDAGFEEYLLLNAALYQKRTVLLLDYPVDLVPQNALLKRLIEMTASIKAMGINVEFLKVFPGAHMDGKASANRLITEKDIVEMWKSGTKEILCAQGCIITPLAVDKAKETGMKILYSER